MTDTNRTLTGAVIAVVLSILALPLGVGLLTGAANAACPISTGITPTTLISTPPTPTTAIAPRTWDDESLTQARATASAAVPDGGLVLAHIPGPSMGASGGAEPLLNDPDCITGGGDGLLPSAAADLPAGYTLPDGTSPVIRTAIAWALAQLGTPYSYGGDCTDPHSGNPAHQCDCSSLVQQAYTHAGIRLPRTTRDQVHAGQPVASLAQIQPGDLIFIPGAHGTRTRPGHVGLYIGNDLIVQAPRTGANVKITKISAWSPTVAAVRRIRT